MWKQPRPSNPQPARSTDDNATSLQRLSQVATTRASSPTRPAPIWCHWVRYRRCRQQVPRYAKQLVIICRNRTQDRVFPHQLSSNLRKQSRSANCFYLDMERLRLRQLRSPYRRGYSPSRFGEIWEWERLVEEVLWHARLLGKLERTVDTNVGLRPGWLEPLNHGVHGYTLQDECPKWLCWKLHHYGHPED